MYIKRKGSNELRTFSYFRNRFYKDNKMITWFLSDCARSIRTCRTRTAPAGWRAGGSSPAGTASPLAAPRWSPRSTSTPATHLTHTITTPTTVIIVYLSHSTVGHRPLTLRPPQYNTLGYIIIITMQSSSKTIVSLFIPWVSNKVKQKNKIYYAGQHHCKEVLQSLIYKKRPMISSEPCVLKLGWVRV